MATATFPNGDTYTGRAYFQPFFVILAFISNFSDNRYVQRSEA